MSDDAPSPTPAVVDDDRSILSDTICVRCGYNLKTLRADGKCPECGVPVADSLMGDRLEYSDPVWLAEITAGVRIVHRTICGLVGYLIISIVWEIALPLGSGMPTNALAAMTGAICLGVGLWRFTAAEPRAAGTGPLMPTRVVARTCLLLTAVSIPGGIAIHGYSAVFAEALLAAGFLTAVCCAIALSVLVRRLALRIPDQKMAATARLNIVGGVLAVLVGSVVLAVDMLMVPYRPSLPLVTTALLGLGLVIVFTIRCMLLLERFRRAVDEVADQALARRTHEQLRRWASEKDAATHAENSPQPPHGNDGA